MGAAIKLRSDYDAEAERRAAPGPAGGRGAGPTPAIHGVIRWPLCDLAQWVWEEYGISISRQSLGRLLREMGLRKLSARPRHYAQDHEAAETFKKTSPPRSMSSWPSKQPAR